jgi:hypothetical protein
LNAIKLSVESRVNMRPCKNGSKKQIWFWDGSKQLHLRHSPDLCLTYKKREIKLDTCIENGVAKRSNFFHNISSSVLYVKKKKRTLYLGIEGGNKYGPVKLFSGGNDRSLRKWFFVQLD